MGKQTGGYSYGVFAAFTGAYYMTLGGNFPNYIDNFSQSDMIGLRNYMQYILFRHKRSGLNN
jgi:hypothetical protein